MRAKIEGVVELEGVVYESGCVGRLSVTRSLQPELDREALRAVSQWRFAPGSRGGTPVPVKVNMELTFTLRR
jgi:protein TonB